jgi:hypothetical protein
MFSYIRDGRVFQLLTFVGKMARTLPTSEATTYAEVCFLLIGVTKMNILI